MSEKLQALKRAVALLGNPNHNYSWGGPSRCNCGVLVQAVTGLTEDQLQAATHEPDDKYMGAWTAQLLKPTEDRNRHAEVLLKELYKVGFTAEEVMNLEYLANSKVQKAAGLYFDPVVDTSYKYRGCVIAYYNGWIKLLELSESSVSTDGALVMEAVPDFETVRVRAQDRYALNYLAEGYVLR